jgi:hypothetical protein
VSWLICSSAIILWSDTLNIGKFENSISRRSLEQGGLQSVYTLSRSLKDRNCVRHWKCVGRSSFYSAREFLNSFHNEVIFIMRLYALYSRSLTIVLFAGCLLAAELSVKIVRCIPSNFLSVRVIHLCFQSGHLPMEQAWFYLKVRLGPSYRMRN